MDFCIVDGSILDVGSSAMFPATTIDGVPPFDTDEGRKTLKGKIRFARVLEGARGRGRRRCRCLRCYSGLLHRSGLI